MSKIRKTKDENSMYTRSINLLEDDPLEEIFALNLGDFLTEHLINPEFADKISKKAKVKDKKESLKEQLKELISIYSIDNTLSLLGFENNEDFVIYNSIAKTVKLMLNLVECNIFLAKKNEPLRHAGSSDEELSNENITEYIIEVMEGEQERVIETNEVQISLFPMKNNFECIGVIEIIRKIERPLEFEYADLIQNMAGLFVTSLGLQKLIDEVKRLLNLDDVATMEFQNLRAQLTAIIGDLGDQQQSFVEKLAYAADLKGQYKRTHSNECAELSREICNHLGLNEKTTDLIYYAGLLQNIGKITLSEELFTKKEKLTDAEWDVYAEGLSIHGAEIAAFRREYVSLLAESAAGYFAGMTGGAEVPGVVYQSHALPEDEEELPCYLTVPAVQSPPVSLQKRLKEKLTAHLDREQIVGTTLVGIHKDDIRLTLNGREAKLYASQGQQRSFVLALKLAEGGIAARCGGDAPIFLLDDVFSELDEKRRAFMMEKLTGRQIILTSCEPGVIPSKYCDTHISFQRVENGTVSPLSAENTKSEDDAPAEIVPTAEDLL